MSQLRPNKWIGSIAFVRGVITDSIKSGLRLNVVGSISMNTGRAPVNSMLFADAMKVKGEVITSSPFPIPAANRATCNAAVPEVVATACFTPHIVANDSSNAFTRGP